MTTRTPAGSPSILWSLNARSILTAIDELAPTARPDIIKATGLAKTTVLQTLAELERRGIVVEAGRDTARRGPAAMLYRIAPSRAYALGVDIGHRTTRVALINLAGGILSQAESPSGTIDERDTAAVVARLRDTCLKLANERGRATNAPTVTEADVTHAVIGVPAVVSPRTGELRLSPGLPNDGANLGETLRDALGIPFTFENDTNLAAVAEYHLGSRTGVESFAYLSVGVGIGAGIVLGGELLRGYSGGAGEIAYLPRDHADDGAEPVIGEVSINRAAREAGLGNQPTPKQVFALARQGDEAALQVVHNTAERLSDTVAALSLTVDPELIVLGGAIGGNNADLLLPEIHKALGERAVGILTTIVPSATGENAVLRGATLLAHREIRDSAFAEATRP
ncbi:ROK family transcriptional regulator [Lysinibacter cavernae]|uniref:Putative NBD/HSP70 family sugar kinase n=1 Tax=Lysinibacter cavernae TaxID=1640652 RepID=A0A7X5TRM6_9MICO|nr:ROK family protein [Lysinibacter cavernae]NIH52371.1 putative NBD/HSP70 family sugar kinase [Lysinibacter cavernae]